VKIAILGGTGSFGRALAARLVALGEDDVVIGSRDAERARETANELGGARVTGATNEDAVRGVDLAVLAVKADAALDTVRAVARALGATPLLSVASAIEFRKGVGMLPDPDARSLAERVQDLVAAPVVAGLHSVAAANLEEQPDEDALVCGDDGAAKELALALAAKLVAGRALDAGPLASARALEGLTAVIVNLNRRYKAHAGMRVTGVE
jgi:8-hydroxy-5-deazaflavin:NADPH oxidoreductase